MYKKIAVCLALFTALAGAYAADIPYVDVEVATKKIADLKTQNQELATQTEDFKKDNDAKDQEVDALVEKINTMQPILDKVDKKGSDLNSVYKTIVDKPTKQKAKDAIDRNTALKTELKADIKKTEFRVLLLQKQIDVNKKQIDINEGRVRTNSDDIALLQSSIEKTTNQTKLISDYIADVESFLSEAEAVLKSTSSQ